jgi:L-amino acid N-acyltransferase YncA
MEIRAAVEDDLEEITAIYNEVLTNSTAIYNDRPASRGQGIAWWKERRAHGCPVLVAATEDLVLGFATFGGFRSWPGYRPTVEASIHMHPAYRGRGVGNRLLEELVKEAREMEKHTMVAAVDSENVNAQRFFERFGFERAGLLKQVGLSLDGIRIWC